MFYIYINIYKYLSIYICMYIYNVYLYIMYIYNMYVYICVSNYKCFISNDISI